MREVKIGTIVLGLLLLPTSLFAQFTCEQLSAGCSENPTCNSQGICSGTPVADGSSCTFQVTTCATQAQCLFGFCVPTDFLSCPPDADPCTLEACNPTTGECESFPACPDTPCATSTCNNGECSFTPRNDGQACQDGNPCTGNDVCQNGLCSGTPGVELSCVGDCDGGGDVTVDEIITMVNIALGNESVDLCRAGDGNGDMVITVDEILTAINHALEGCPQP